MSDYMTNVNYNELLHLRSRKFSNKSVLIIGAGWMAEQYLIALQNLGIKKITILGNSKKKVVQLSEKFGCKGISGGYENNSKIIQDHDLTIVSTPVDLLSQTVESILDSQTNILVEKPGGLYSKDLRELKEKDHKKQVKVGYNRLVYPSFLKLKSLIKKDEGITSCTFSFVEWIHKMDFKKYNSNVYQRWGIANSLHVISMVFDLIGLPKELSAHQSGYFDWHKTGSKFIGMGVSTKDIPFSYHSDWNSSGRWEIKVMTKNNVFLLSPLEKLFVCKKGSTIWKEIDLDIPYPESKPGIAEEISFMLDMDKKKKLLGLDKATDLIIIAEKIFGY